MSTAACIAAREREAESRCARERRAAQIERAKICVMI